MNQAQWKINSKIGPLFLVASPKGLRGIFWKKQPARMMKTLTVKTPEVKILSKAALELGQYFEGKRTRFTVPLDLQGTAFQKRVWKELQKIPYGKTHSYKDIASRIKNKNAFRAVGTANGENPACIIVPCHRVIAANGSLGGYSGGLKIKSALLSLERGD